ncbi:HAD-IIIC family phosphatase [bacterium]|nr:HAD-IIIC family phosphatase [bacterium]
MTEQSFYRILKAHIEKDEQIVVLHSSLINFNLDWNVAKWPLLSALKRLTGEGITLVVPCFTFSFCKGVPYHHLHSNSEVGVLGDWFRGLDGVVRTQHPIYSFAVVGPKASLVLDCDYTTTFGMHSPFALFEKEGARLIMFGNEWKYCTQLHHQEELSQVPYRSFKTFIGDADVGNGVCKTEASMFVRDHDLKPKNNFSSIIQQLRKNNKIYTNKLAGAIVSSTTASALGKECSEHLLRDKYSFVEQPHVVRYQQQNRKLRSNSSPLRIALLGQSNLQLVESALHSNIEKMIHNQDVEIFTSPFGQSYKMVIDNNSDLWEFNPDFIFFLDRPEDICRQRILKDDSNNEKLLQYIDIIRKASSYTKGTVYVSGLTYSEASVFIAENRTSKSQSNLETMNERLLKDLYSLGNVEVIDINYWYTRFTEGGIKDERLWFIGRFPYSNLFSNYLGKCLAGIILAESGRNIRLMIVDLDNTLWGGVLGEDGVEELQLGGDYPGNAFRYFQEVIRQKIDSGIAVSVVSKNNEKDALNAISVLTDMQFREDVLAAWRINWDEKWCNILKIADEIGVGLENIIFIDDNPVEREKVRQNLPAIKVLELPDDPADYGKALLDCPYFEQVRINGEDKRRSRQYSNKRLMEKERMNHVSPEEFLASLQPSLYIEGLSAINISRAVQLVTKTNQFNTTTIRYTRTELDELTKSGRSVYVLGLEDRFTEQENIGVGVIHWNNRTKSATIESFLLSCRVLERGIETGFLAWIYEQCKIQKIDKLVGHIVKTPRNIPAQKLYKEHGFSFDSVNKIWTLDLTMGSSIKKPVWLATEEVTTIHE